jgi:hypothetical protein
MKKLLISGIIAFFSMQLVQANTICDARISLADARFNLMMMVMSTGKAKQDALKVKIDNASTALEKAFDAMRKDENKTDDAQIQDFQGTWAAFKNTRETEIIPAIYAGNHEIAIGIAMGIQAERMTEMTDIIQALNGDNCN